VLGIETPLVGVEEIRPASVTTVGLDDLSMETTCYWRPTHDPVDRPASHFVERIADTLRQIFAEWTHSDLDYGLLLSGGGDSRFVGALIDEPVTAFHHADWMSREARVARRVAETAGDEFHLLERSDDHEARSLEHNARLSNFSGWFDQAYFTQFEEEIRGEVDVLVSGLFADTLFSDEALPTRRLSLEPLGTVDLPLGRPVADVDDYVDAILADVAETPYFESDRSLRDVLVENIRRTDDGVVSHGVRYESLTDLVMYGDYYPLSADTEAIFSRSLAGIRPYRSPFLDNRLIDIQQRIPVGYLLRRDLVGSALKRVAPELAEIPNAEAGVAPGRSFPVQYAGRHLNAFYRKFVDDDAGPAPHLDNGPWPNRVELLRARPFARDAIRENEDLLRDLPFLDYEDVERTLRAHEAGENNQPAIYSLLTLLGMPLTEEVRRSSTDGT
jgi:asparagine synthase (glutamine-hydrolysing)